MVNRPAGGPRSEKYERAPYDWYCESSKVVEQLFAGLGPGFFVSASGPDLIWDPCCGRGNVLDVAKRWGHRTVGSDVVDRCPKHRFFRANALIQTKPPAAPGCELSIVSNTPYHYEPNIAERIIAHLLETFCPRRAAFILPIAFLAGQERWRGGRFAGRFRPSHVGIYRERHTMPPGHLIETMPRPFEGGMADYCVLAFTPPHRWRTETVWLPTGPQHPEARVPNPRGVTSAKERQAA